MRESISTATEPHPSYPRHSDVYRDWLRQKVEHARLDMRTGQGISNDEVEAEFAAKRQRAVSVEGRACA